MRIKAFLSLLFALTIISNVVTAQDSTLDAGDGVTLTIERFEVLDQVGRLQPSNGSYLIMFASFENTDSRERCVFARDVRLIHDEEAYAPERAPMSAVRDTLTPRREFIGPVLGHCADPGESEPTFAVFDVPEGMQEFTIRFYEAEQQYEGFEPVQVEIVEATDANDVADNDLAGLIEEWFLVNDFVKSVEMVSVFPAQDEEDGYLVYAEITVEPNALSESNATLLRLNVGIALDDATISDFSIIMTDCARAVDYRWDQLNNEWIVTELSIVPVC